MKTPYLKKKLHVVDCADTRFSNFVIEYLTKTKKFANTVFASSLEAQVEFCKQNKCRKSRDTVPLSYALFSCALSSKRTTLPAPAYMYSIPSHHNPPAPPPEDPQTP